MGETFHLFQPLKVVQSPMSGQNLTTETGGSNFQKLYIFGVILPPLPKKLSPPLRKSFQLDFFTDGEFHKYPFCFFSNFFMLLMFSFNMLTLLSLFSTFMISNLVIQGSQKNWKLLLVDGRLKHYRFSSNTITTYSMQS